MDISEKAYGIFFSDDDTENRPDTNVGTTDSGGPGEFRGSGSDMSSDDTSSFSSDADDLLDESSLSDEEDTASRPGSVEGPVEIGEVSDFESSGDKTDHPTLIEAQLFRIVGADIASASSSSDKQWEDGRIYEILGRDRKERFQDKAGVVPGGVDDDIENGEKAKVGMAIISKKKRKGGRITLKHKTIVAGPELLRIAKKSPDFHDKGLGNIEKNKDGKLLLPEEEVNQSLQCHKCKKLRLVPGHISLDDLPLTWHCGLNTWEPKLASCEAHKKDLSCASAAHSPGRKNTSGQIGKTKKPIFRRSKNAPNEYLLRECQIIPPGTHVKPRTLFSYIIDLHVVPLLMDARWFCSKKTRVLEDSIGSNRSASTKLAPSDVLFFPPGVTRTAPFQLGIHYFDSRKRMLEFFKSQKGKIDDMSRCIVELSDAAYMFIRENFKSNGGLKYEIGFKQVLDSTIKRAKESCGGIFLREKNFTTSKEDCQTVCSNSCNKTHGKNNENVKEPIFGSSKHSKNDFSQSQCQILPSDTRMGPTMLFRYMVDMYIVPLLIKAGWRCSKKARVIKNLPEGEKEAVRACPCDLLFVPSGVEPRAPFKSGEDYFRSRKGMIDHLMSFDRLNGNELVQQASSLIKAIAKTIEGESKSIGGLKAWEDFNELKEHIYRKAKVGIFSEEDRTPNRAVLQAQSTLSEYTIEGEVDGAGSRNNDREGRLDDLGNDEEELLQLTFSNNQTATGDGIRTVNKKSPPSITSSMTAVTRDKRTFEASKKMPMVEDENCIGPPIDDPPKEAICTVETSSSQKEVSTRAQSKSTSSNPKQNSGLTHMGVPSSVNDSQSHYKTFVEKYEPVREIEYNRSGVHEQIVNGSMWRAHKTIYGEECTDSCPCPSTLDRLTSNVVLDSLQTGKTKFELVGFVNVFAPRIYLKVCGIKEEVPC